MASERIQRRGPFPLTTHGAQEAPNLDPAGKHHEATETTMMSHVPGNEVVEEKEGLSLSPDLALLFVMKEHTWERPSNSMEEDSSEDLEGGQRGLENRAELSEGKSNLSRGQAHPKKSRDSSLNSLDGECAAHSSSSPQSSLLDTASSALTSPRRVSVGQTESRVLDARFCRTLSPYDTLSQTWREEPAVTDTLLAQEESVGGSPLVIHNLSNCHRNADFSKPWADEDHSWEPERQHEENRDLFEGMDIEMRPNEISSKREEASERLSNPSSEEEELSLEVAQRKADNISFHPTSKAVENYSDTGDELGNLEQNVPCCPVLHLQEEEESDMGVSSPLLPEENVQTHRSKSSMDCDGSESGQKEVPTTMGPEPAEGQALELVGGEEEEGEKDLNREEVKSKRKRKRKTNLGEAELGHDDQEEQERAMQATTASTKDWGPMPIILGQEALGSLEDSLALSGLNNNGAVVGSEEFAFPFKEASSAGHSPKSACALPEACAQTVAIPLAGMTPAGTQALIYLSSGQLEPSGIYDKASTIFCCGQGGARLTAGAGKDDVEKEDSGNSGKEESVRSADGEQITQLLTDLALAIDPQDLHGSQPTGHSFDAEKDPVPSLRTITSALLQEGASKGATDGAATRAGSKSALHLSSPLDGGICEEASALGSDGDDHLHTFGKDSLEDAQSSTSKVPPNPSLEEGLSNIAQEMVNLSLYSSFATWDSVQDTTKNYVTRFHQQLKPPAKKAVLSGKEAAAEALSTEQDILTSESPCFSALEEDRTECDGGADGLPSSWTLFAGATDAAQLTQPLAPVLVADSEQTLALAPALLSSSWHPVGPPPAANCTAQPVPPGLSPDQLLEQLSCSSQADPCFAPKPPAPQAVAEHSAVAPETRLPEQPPASESNLDQRCQVPHSVHGSKASLSVAHGAGSPAASKRSVFPSLRGSAAFQLTNPKRVRESGAGNNRLTQLPLAALSRGSHSPELDSRSRKHLTFGGSPSAQRGAESSGTNALASCTGSEEQMHASAQVPSPACWNPPSISETDDLARISSLDSRVEETSAVPLAKSAEANTLRGQKGQDKTFHELGLYLSDLQGDLLGNGAMVADSFSSVPETMSKCEDVHDGRSFHHTSHPPGDREKPCESRHVRQPPSLLAFTNPIHFLQLGPPSPPASRYAGVHQADFQGPSWQEQQARHAEDPIASPSEGPGRFRKVLEKSGGEPVGLAIHRKDAAGRHPRLEKSSSCPDKNAIGLGMKEPVFSTKKQEAGIKPRAKSKDWHRHGVRKISLPTDSAAEVIASLAHSKEETPGSKDRANPLDFEKDGEKETTETIENIKRRHSRLINSSRLLYQEYSDDALNKAIQSQKRADSLSEEAELGSPKLRRKGLSPQDSYLQRLSVSSGSSLWQDIPMVRGSTMLLSMTREEQKLQEAKFELIASEASYLRSLNVAVDHFQHSQELQGVLTTQDKQWLFSRLQDVRDVSASFLYELEEKLGENMFTFNVCDVALRHAPEFRRVYLPYVTNQTYQEQTFKRLRNGVPAFQQVLEKLESDPVCQRLSLKSFLILPFQRITRLKLLLQNILKRIPPGADEEVQATQAYDALEKLIKDCNANVQRMKSTEELIHLSQNMEFECKIFPLISQSRRLVKHGELTALEYNISLKWKLTTRPIYLHLFNDYLLLSRPRENGRFIVFDYAASSDVRGEKCEMKLHGANKNLFRLFLLQNNQGKKVEFLFRTETQSEKLRWISALLPQQPEPDLLDDSDAPQVQCMKSYKARENDELTLEKADIVMVLRQSSDGWIEGVKLSDAERGWFPSDHVEFISSKHARQVNLEEEQRVKNAKQQVFRRK